MNSNSKTDWNRQFHERRSDGLAPFFLERQQTAFEAFRDTPFPHSGMEEWKYTHLDDLMNTAYSPVPDARPETLPSQLVYKYSFTDMKRIILVFVNGHFSAAHSQLEKRSDCPAVISSLREALNTYPDIVKKHFNTHCRNGNDKFSLMNTALSPDGAFVYIPDNTELKEAVHIMYLSTGLNRPFYTQPRNLIVLGKNSSATVVETYNGLDTNPYLTNSGAEVYVDDNASLRYHKVQLESMNSTHLSSTTAILEQDARFLSTSINFGGVLNRNNIDAVLNGSGARCDLYGLYMGKDSQHFDNRTLIHHVAPRSESNQIYKGILDEHSRGVFNGQILVERDAQKINARQLNKNLLLSPDAKADSKPQLKIFADDVKCSHGATVGQLDEDALFYLRSRGIGEDVARSMLTYAFASDIIDSVIVGSVRFYLYSALLNRLGKGWEQL